ncbi:MAG: alpha-1,2-mannosyltransferase (Kre5) [Trizodia sp. TS-e1964]|nr:MAG: alpha-1,2-mannosyltransferase (Kre5) [Trizodia sp. TS-e1964]
MAVAGIVHILRTRRLLHFIFVSSLVLFVYHTWAYFHGLPRAPHYVEDPNQIPDAVFQRGCRIPDVSAPREAATFVALVRNSELEGIVHSIKSIEARFNRWFGYPYTFLNDEPFTEEFVAELRRHTNASLQFGLIPREHWGYPDWVDVGRAREAMDKAEKAGVIYGGMESYHHMCRFYSGDPFRSMRETNKTYGFNIAHKEYPLTVRNLYAHVSDFSRRKSLPPQRTWEMFTSRSPFNLFKPAHSKDAQGNTYNMCHFWSNFEIASLDWLRDKQYAALFEELDRAGGFFYERWGDAPVHSLAAGALLPPSAVHYFEDIGYRHDTLQHCPLNFRSDSHANGEAEGADAGGEGGVGCRCACEAERYGEMERSQSSCIGDFRRLFEPLAQ